MAQSSLDKQLDLAIGNLVIVIGKVLNLFGMDAKS